MRFEFTIEPKTMDQIKSSVNLIKTVSPERFQEEFKKMFEKSTHQVWCGSSKRNRNTQKVISKKA